MTDLKVADVEAVIVAWLTPLGTRCAAVRKPNEELPFILVNHVSGTEEDDDSLVVQTVSVHTMIDRSAGHAALAAASEETSKRMRQLNVDPDIITLLDGSQCGIDFCKTVEPWHEEFFADDILRSVSRWHIGLTYDC